LADSKDETADREEGQHRGEQSLGGDFGTRAGRGFLIASRLTFDEKR